MAKRNVPYTGFGTMQGKMWLASTMARVEPDIYYAWATHAGTPHSTHVGNLEKLLNAPDTFQRLMAFSPQSPHTFKITAAVCSKEIKNLKELREQEIANNLMTSTSIPNQLYHYDSPKDSVSFSAGDPTQYFVSFQIGALLP
jgi:hypothetical protein